MRTAEAILRASLARGWPQVAAPLVREDAAHHAIEQAQREARNETRADLPDEIELFRLIRAAPSRRFGDIAKHIARNLLPNKEG